MPIDLSVENGVATINTPFDLTRNILGADTKDADAKLRVLQRNKRVAKVHLNLLMIRGEVREIVRLASVLLPLPTTPHATVQDVL